AFWICLRGRDFTACGTRRPGPPRPRGIGPSYGSKRSCGRQSMLQLRQIDLIRDLDLLEGLQSPRRMSSLAERLGLQVKVVHGGDVVITVLLEEQGQGRRERIDRRDDVGDDRQV